MLSVRGLCKSYTSGRRPTLALDGVDVEVEQGAFATVLGPSGSGKTTLLRCIAGFDTPDSGVITLGGRELVSAGVNVRPYDRGVGVVPQEGALFPHLTVARNIAFGIGDRPRDWRAQRVEEMLELIGLQGLGQRRPHQLSGGQQQRVALARALAPEPQLVLLDEPFSALDAQLRVELREEVRTLLQQFGTTALLVTHDQAEAMTLADHLVVMRAGRVVASGDPRRVYDSPIDSELGRFLGEAVVLPGILGRDGGAACVDCALGRLAVVGGPDAHSATGFCEVLLRPEHLSVRLVGSGDLAARPGQARTSTGVVIAQSFYGHDALVRVRLDSDVQVCVRVHGSDRFAVGDVVQVRVDAPVT
ncbi:MAG: ABC transporter ATP-binding protein, partial [Micrococcales bacterium]|nr:ABC transporter ATP-binding protein [Micrococcales bacterium]